MSRNNEIVGLTVAVTRSLRTRIKIRAALLEKTVEAFVIAAVESALSTELEANRVDSI